MKKRTKIAFGFIALISFTSLTYALTTPVQVSGEIRNKVTADLITTRNTVSGTGTVGKYIETYGTNIKNISGENANGGIRVRTVVKEKKGLFYSTISDSVDAFIMSPNSTTSITSYYTLTENNNNIKVEWQNWTGNTSLEAIFRADNQ